MAIEERLGMNRERLEEATRAYAGEVDKIAEDYGIPRDTHFMAVTRNLVGMLQDHTHAVQEGTKKLEDIFDDYVKTKLLLSSYLRLIRKNEEFRLKETGKNGRYFEDLTVTSTEYAKDAKKRLDIQF